MRLRPKTDLKSNPINRRAIPLSRQPKQGFITRRSCGQPGSQRDSGGNRSSSLSSSSTSSWSALTDAVRSTFAAGQRLVEGPLTSKGCEPINQQGEQPDKKPVYRLKRPFALPLRGCSSLSSDPCTYPCPYPLPFGFSSRQDDPRHWPMSDNVTQNDELFSWKINWIVAAATFELLDLWSLNLDLELRSPTGCSFIKDVLNPRPRLGWPPSLRGLQIK